MGTNIQSNNRQANISEYDFRVYEEVIDGIKIFEYSLPKQLIEEIETENLKFKRFFSAYFDIDSDHPYPYSMSPNAVKLITEKYVPALLKSFHDQRNLVISKWDSLALGRILEKFLIPTAIEPMLNAAELFVNEINKEFLNEEQINIFEFSTGAGLNLRALAEYFTRVGLWKKIHLETVDMSFEAALMSAFVLQLSREKDGNPKFPFKIIYGSRTPTSLGKFKGILLRVSKAETAIAADVVAQKIYHGFIESNGRIYYSSEANQQIHHGIMQLISKAGCVIEADGLEPTTSIELDQLELLKKIAFGKGLYKKYLVERNFFPKKKVKIKNGKETDVIYSVNSPSAGKVYDMLNKMVTSGNLWQRGRQLKMWMQLINRVSKLTVDLQKSILMPIEDIFMDLLLKTEQYDRTATVLVAPGTRKSVNPEGETIVSPEIFRSFLLKIN